MWVQKKGDKIDTGRNRYHSGFGRVFGKRMHNDAIWIKGEREMSVLASRAPAFLPGFASQCTRAHSNYTPDALHTIESFAHHRQTGRFQRERCPSLVPNRNLMLRCMFLLLPILQ